MARATSRVSGVVMTGSLAPFEEAYRGELRRRGYTVRSAVCEVRQVARFSRWLEADGLGVSEVNESRVDEFMVWQRARGQYRSHWSRPGLRCLLCVLRGLGVLAAEDLWRRARRRMRCWIGLSAIWWPSAGWRSVLSPCIRLAFAGS